MKELNKEFTEPVIKIFLTDSSHAKKFDGENLIHQEEFGKTIDLVTRSLENVKNDPDSKYLHNTITILGTRGSGKTSFLLSINKSLEKDNEIEVLDIIDPTLIEEKGHVFLNVISLIMDLVEEKLNKQECHPPNENKSIPTRKQWRDSLNKLSAGIPSIDGIGKHNGDSWQDPEFVMDIGLISVSASQKLADNFNTFLKVSLEILDKKAFLLMFDDIDVDASKGWVVLETIRKYFTSARLITLLSGDLKLYSTVVRQKKWENFGKEILKYEGKYQNQVYRFNDMVTELEAQYLQKIMQTNLRIHIPTLEQKSKKIQNIKVCKTLIDSTINETICTDLKVYYYGILKYFGIHNEFQANCYYSFLLRQPLRSQIQFMNLFEVADRHTLSEPDRLLDVFYSDLSEKGINIQLVSLSETHIVSEILRFLNKEKRLFDLYQLQPTTTDNSLNASIIALNFLLSHRIQKDNIYLVFEYFIKIGCVRNLLPLVEDSSGKNFGPNINDLCTSSNLFNDSVFRDQVGHMIAYMRASIDFTTKMSEFKLNAGTIPIYGEKAKSKQKLETLSNRIDSHFSDKDNLLKKLVYIPLSANQYSKKHSSLLTYSIYLLLATIAEILKRNSTSENIVNDLLELSQLRSFVMPDFQGANDDDENEPIIDVAINNEESTKVSDLENKFINSLKEWIEAGRNIQINPHVMGKVSTRLAYALDNIETAYNGKENLGKVFHAQIVSFLNAILIEDVREKSGIKGLNLNNTRFSDKIFINNIKSQLVEENGIAKVKKQEDLTFSRWLFKCPLIICYLNIEEKKQRNVSNMLKDINTIKQALESYSDFTNEDTDLFKDFSVFSILEKVSIRNQTKESERRGTNRNIVRKKTVTVKQLSLGVTKQYDEIVELLKSIPVSFALFKESERSQTIQNNRIIKEELEKLEITALSVFNIAKFRKHLKTNKIKW